jgi:hypothetical protein
MERIVLPELLDVLPPQDQSALRSRRDLRRLNAWMGHPRVMARVLQKNLMHQDARQIVELGAGDGHFLLSVARRLRGQWPGAKATLVDRLDVLDPQTREHFNQLGWNVHAEIAEATEWLRKTSPETTGAVISNLFFHQFQTEQLAELLRLAARSSRMVVALEPRRSWVPRLCGRLLWVIGCGPVTCHDGRISIRAGFAGSELSALWPDKKNWELVERPVGLFSHLFIARRKD